MQPSETVMREIPTRHYRHRQDLHALDRRQPSFLPGVGHDYEGTSMRLYETFLGEVDQQRVVAQQVYSPSSSSSALASWRSAVSKPSVNQL